MGKLFGSLFGQTSPEQRKNQEKKKQEKVDRDLKKLAPPIEGESVSENLDENLRMMQKLFRDDDALVTRRVGNSLNRSLEYLLFYCDGMVNSQTINESVIRPLTRSEERPGRDALQTLAEKVLIVNEVKKTDDWNEIIRSVTYGDTILFAQGCAQALLLNTKSFELRSPMEPDNEKILTGPREGFNESMITSISMIRRRLRTNTLKLKYRQFGRTTHTQACVCYLDSVVNKRVLRLLNERLDKIDMDGVLDTNYLTELIRDSALSPFRTTGYTERPDVVASKLLEGRIAVILDGSPVALLLPYLFAENFQSSEDYYLSFFYTSFSRLLRILGFFLTISVPAVYIAIVAFHQEMLPTPLLVNIARERQGVPLPASLEAFIMLIVFDILRETGVRMPSNVGQALSIVGALVIGQAAVEARMVAAPMIIVVGLTGITGLLVPKMNSPIIFARMGLLFCSSIFGLFGLVIGLSFLLIHLLNLTSFGISQLTPVGRLKFQELKDIPIRAPWWKMVTLPQKLTKDKVRMNPPQKNQP